MARRELFETVLASVAAAAFVVIGLPGHEEQAPVRRATLRYETVSDARLRGPDPKDWLMYRRTYNGWGFSPLSEINARNARELDLAWAARTDAEDGQPQAPPIVNGGWMFVTSAEQVIALSPATGRLRWRYRHLLPSDLRRPHATNRGVALYGDMVFVATLDARVVALDARTGGVVWNRVLADYRRTYYVTLAPLAVNGGIIVGVSGGEHGIRGFVTALDAATGDELWKRHTIPAPGEFGGSTWEGGAWRTGGGAVWLTGTYDPETNVTYWGVGNGGPWTGDARPGDNLFTNSTLALDADTGAILSHFQYHWNGSWDWDESVAPLLVDVERGGRTFKGLVHAGRNGFLWLLDRGADGMRFVDAEPFVHQNVFTDIDPVTGRPTYDPARVPRIGVPAEFCPAISGGRNWRPEAYSPRTRLLYIPATIGYCSRMEGRTVAYRPGRSFMGADSDTRPREGVRHHGQLQAWDLDTGERIWIRVFRNAPGSVLATGGDLVFVDAGGTLYALDAATGYEIWKFRSDRHVPTGVPVTYVSRGVQFVAVQFEPRWDAPDAGNVVMAFALRHRVGRAR